MPTSVNLKAKGLHTSPNTLTLEPGSLLEANNIVIRRDNVVEPRRGFKLYGTSFGSSVDTASQLLEYKERLIRHYGNILEYQDGVNNNGDVTFSQFAGTYSDPIEGRRLRSVQANGNLYFTSSDGIRKISAKTSSDLSTDADFVTKAGGVKAIDVTARIESYFQNSSGFLPNDSAVAYRVVWGQKDLNSNLILGTPSPRVEVYNYLLSNIINDMARVLVALDNISTSMINDANYVSTLALPYTASVSEVRANLITLTEKLDNDILYANTTGVGAPLTISTAAISSGIVTINFSAGTATDYFQPGSKIFLAGFSPAVGTLNGAQVASSVTATTVTFVTTATGAVTVDPAATLVSNEYRGITQPDPPSIIATHQETQEVQIYLEAIIDRLQIEPIAVISSTLADLYIAPLTTTVSVAVELKINIPADVTANNFYQVYRSAIVQATGVASLTDLAPNDELQLVLENFPTTEELAAGQIIVEDITPDEFRGANLYTNPSSGEGIAQSNDVPPLSSDVNSFKGYTFYSNTQTRHRKSLSLLGVSKLIEDYNNSITPKLVIASSLGRNIYSFVTGVKQEVQIITDDASTLVATANPASYFTISSANNVEKYYVWYQLGLATDPAVAGHIGIPVAIDVADLAAQVATKTANKLKEIPEVFTASAVSDVITITNIQDGYTDGPTQGTSNFGVSIAVDGRGEKATRETTEVTTVADVAGSLAGVYFTLNEAFDDTQYYVWYKVSGVGADPALANKTGILVNILTNDSANAVAAATATTLNDTFTASAVGDVVTVQNRNFGPTATATAGTSGFSVFDAVTGALEVLLSDQVSSARSVDATARSLVSVINQNSSENVYAFYLSGALDVPGKMLLENRSLGQPEFYILANTDNAGSSFNPSLSPSVSITSISTGNPNTMLVTTSAPHGLLNQDQVVIAGTDSTHRADGLYSITYVSPTTFRIPLDITVAGTTGAIRPANTTQVSENEEKSHRLYFSKFQQPEAVPIVNYLDIGATGKAILRIFPLRDSLFIFKEDGLFRISGEISPFSVGLFDSSCILLAPDSVSVSNNLVYCWTTQGVSTVSETGINVISRPIDNKLLPLHNLTNFKTATWGMGYESDQAYLVWTVENGNDTRATICYRYSALTDSWTIFDKTNTCGIINPVDDKIYLGAGDVNYLEQERKDFTRYDYADRQFDITLTVGNYTGTKLKLSSVAGIAIGDVLVQDQTLSLFEYNGLLAKLDVDPGVADNDYASTLSATRGVNLRTSLLALAAKLDADANIVATDFVDSISTKSGSITTISVANPTVITSTAHELETGRIITIQSTDSSPDVNGQYTVTVIDANTFSVPVAVTSPGTTGTWATVDNSFEDLKACYNTIIQKLNADTGVSYQNYREVDNNTSQETIITGVTTSTKEITITSAIDLVAGTMTVFKAIESSMLYGPIYGQDPSALKHLREATMMFASKAFTKATVSFSTDLLPLFVPTDFNGDGNGMFGSNNFGAGFFGGGSHSAPFRTYIPRPCQRCRFLNMRFTHKTAREAYAIYGSSITGEFSISERAYR